MNAILIRLLLPIAALGSISALASGCSDASSGADAASMFDAPVVDAGLQPYVPVYPVDPRVQVEHATSDPLDRSTFTPDIPNDVAHARYAINGMRPDMEPLPGDEAILRAALAELAQGSGLTPQQTLGYYAIEATSEEQAAFEAESEAHAQGATTEGTLPTSGRRLVAARKQVQACMLDRSGDAAAQDHCCQALAFPTMLIGEWGRLSQEERDALLAAAAQADFYTRFIEPPDGTAAPGVRLQGIKVWLGACGAALAQAPATLADFKAMYGDYRDGTWSVELHPVSMAKLAGRRIYRKGAISIAESLADDCTVRETEVILPRADGELQFWTYERDGNQAVYGYFPTGKPNVDIVKYTPDSCMGCHYTLDSRRFVVRFPSYQSLKLVVRYDRNGVPLWKDHSACEQPGDHVVGHAELPPPPM